MDSHKDAALFALPAPRLTPPSSILKMNVTTSAQPSSPNPQALSAAAADAVLNVESIDAEGEDAIRLKRMGICEGRRLQLVQAGDPLIVRVVGCRVGISKRLAARVRVIPCSDRLSQLK